MISQDVNNITESGLGFSDSPSAKKAALEKILLNLSSMHSKTYLDLTNVGIHIHDPYSIQETITAVKPSTNSAQARAISLRSKSTRNLKTRDYSFSNLLQSFKLTEKIDEKFLTKNFDMDHYDELEKIRCRQRLTPITEGQKRKTNDGRKQKDTVQDSFQNKKKKSNKSLRNGSKEKISRRSHMKILKYSSLTPSKYS